MYIYLFMLVSMVRNAMVRNGMISMVWNIMISIIRNRMVSYVMGSMVRNGMVSTVGNGIVSVVRSGMVSTIRNGMVKLHLQPIFCEGLVFFHIHMLRWHFATSYSRVLQVWVTGQRRCSRTVVTATMWWTTVRWPSTFPPAAADKYVTTVASFTSKLATRAT